MEDSLSDIVRDWKLESAIGDGYTVHTKYVSDRATGAWRTRVEEKWEREAKELGRGAFGVVWLERCTSGPGNGKVRAVKQVYKNFGPSSIAYKALSRELSTIIKFSHEAYRDCFVQSFGWYDNADFIFIVMEYLPLGDLSQYLQQPLPEPQAGRISLQVLQGLSFMHQNNFAHRDLKPSNILVQHQGPNWWVKISDFGTCKQIEVTALRTAVGTELYQAPETRGIHRLADIDDEVDEQTFSLAVDTWAIGAIAFRMVTGRTPFAKKRELYRYVVQEGPFPAQSSLSVECNSFMEQMMSASPHQRPTTSQALTHAWLTTPVTTSICSSDEMQMPLAVKTTDDGPEGDTLTASAAWPASDYGTKLETHFADFSLEQQTRQPWHTTEDKNEDKSIEIALDHQQSYILKSEAPDASNLPVLRVRFSPDGKLLVVITHNEVRIWEMGKDGRFVINHSLLPPERGIGFFHSRPFFMVNNRHIIAFSDGSFTLWEADAKFQDSRRLHIDNLKLQLGLYTFALSPDGQLLVVSISSEESSMSEIRIFRASVEGEFREIQKIKDEAKSFSLLVSPDCQQFAQKTETDAVIWRIGLDGTYEPTQRMAYPSSVIAFSQNCRYILVEDMGLFVYKRDRFGWYHRIQALAGPDDIRLLPALSPDERRIATVPSGLARGLPNKTVTLWESNSEGKFVLKDYLSAHPEDVTAIAFSPDGRWLVSGMEDGTAVVWEIQHGKPQVQDN